jgi:site-specific DNA-methyltransferase (cytosine-N4-specific)
VEAAVSEPYYSDESVTLYHGQALDVLREMPDESVNCVVTSPPYFGLRDYGVAGQIGAESSPAEFVAALAAVFREARRVLADDGTLWLNLGDSYSAGGLTRAIGRNDQGRDFGSGNTGQGPGSNPGRQGSRPTSGEAPAKNLLGIPWRVALALQDDGWILRNDIIWAKPNAMPESVTDRLSTKHEHLFLFSKSRRYWFDLDPIREPTTGQPQVADLSGRPFMPSITGKCGRGLGAGRAADHELGRNPGDVWTIPTQPFPGAHFATFPVELPRRCIAAGCKPGGVVLDPFSGSGTTGLAAAELGRRYVGIDINADYLELSLRTRLRQPSLTAEGGGAA